MYQILRIYDDCTSATEYTDSIIQALNACTIYLEDPSCEGVKIWNVDTGIDILNYWKPMNLSQNSKQLTNEKNV